MPDESEVSCESCDRSITCKIHHEMQLFVKDNWVYFGWDVLPVQNQWYEFLASQCNHYTTYHHVSPETLKGER